MECYKKNGKATAIASLVIPATALVSQASLIAFCSTQADKGVSLLQKGLEWIK